MKILQVISSFPPAYSYGGALKVAYGLSKELVKRGHGVTVYTTDVKDANSRLEFSNNPVWMDGIEVYHFKNLSNKLGHKNFPLAPAMALKLKKELLKFDVVHVHEYRSFHSIFVYYYCKKYKIPYVLQSHGSAPRTIEKKKLKWLFDVAFGYKIFKDASKVIAVTKIEANQYKSMGVSEEKIEVVPNGIDLSEFGDLPDRGEFRKKWDIVDSQKIILYLARIHKIKGPDLLAKAFAELSKEIDNVKLVVAGPDDGYLPSLKKLMVDLEISDRVLFTGPLYGEEKLEAYVDADVYVLSSIYEIFGITVLEALACGTPVVITDRCGIADVIDNQAGLVVPYDKEQLSNAILYMLNDDKMQLQFGEKGKLMVRERFNWEKIAGQVESLYFDIANKRF